MFNKIISPMLLKEVDKPFNSKDYIYELNMMELEHCYM